MAEEKTTLPPAPEDPAPGTFEPGEVPAPAVQEFVHPGVINGYEVLDLTTQYNLAHDPVPGYYRVTSTRDSEVNRDVVTDAPSGLNGEVTDTTKAAIKAAIKELEALRKGK
jgi:hypothetical protein